MILKCSYCGHTVMVNGLGRKPLNIALKNVCESLRLRRSVKATAQELNCSPGYIYNALARHNLTPKEVIENDQSRYLL